MTGGTESAIVSLNERGFTSDQLERGTINANTFISTAFRNLGLNTGPWRTDSEACTRIGILDKKVIMVSNQQEKMKVGEARSLRVSVTTKRQKLETNNVELENVQEAIENLFMQLEDALDSYYHV